MSSERVVTLKLDGDIAKGGRVPIELLAEKLKALQEMVFAAAQVVRPVLPKGKKRNETAQAKLNARDACLLVFKDLRKNCLTLEAELPPTDALFQDVDWGLQSVDCAGAFLWAIQEKDEARLATLVPEPSRRLNLVKKAEHLMPRSSNLTVSLSTPHQFVDMGARVEAYIRHLEQVFSAERKADIRTVTGEVFRSDSAAGVHGQIGITVKGHHLLCDLSEATKAQICDYSPGVMVEVTGKALLTKKGKVRRILEAQHLRALGMEPLPWTRVTYGERDFHLRQPLMVKVHFDEEGWTYKSEDLGIFGYGRTRKDAAASFQEDFAACWDNIALAPDEALSGEALELKRKMLAAVKSCGSAE